MFKKISTSVHTLLSYPSLLTFSLLALLFIAAVTLRLWFISDHHFIFWYDQARDAYLSREISPTHPKIFGPTASGTQDMVFHGVLYYYFIAPFYHLSLDPQLANNALAVFTSLAIIPVFLLARAFFKKDVPALLTSFLITFSAANIMDSTWLSNPALAIVFLPCFFYGCWLILQKITLPRLIWTFFAFGLVVQSIFFGIFWGLALVAILIYAYYHQRPPLKKFLFDLIWAGLVLLLAVSTMILAELLMIQRGILTWDSLRQIDSGQGLATTFEYLTAIISRYLEKIGLSLIPRFAALSATLFLILLPWLIKKTYRVLPVRIFYLLTLLLTPGLFLLLYFKNSVHIFIGLEVIIYLILILGCQKLLPFISQNKKIQATIICLAGFIFIGFNFISLQQIRINNRHPYSIQTGVSLHNQLDLIDQTYALAKYQPFTFSANTNPYGINITWSYLYNWYGQQKYGYRPTFVGPDQTGLVGAQLLERDTPDHPAQEPHFTIYEPDTHLAEPLLTDFNLEQTNFAGTPSSTLNFGTITLVPWQSTLEPQN